MLDCVEYDTPLDDPETVVVVRTVFVMIVVRVGQVFVLASASDAATASPAAIGTRAGDHICSNTMSFG